MNPNLKAINDIQFGNSLREHCTAEKLAELIKAKVSSIPNIESQKYNPELVLFIAKLIEQTVYDNTLSPDKATLFIDIYKHVFELDARDEVIFRRLVDFMLDNNMVSLETRTAAFFKRLFGFASRLLAKQLSKA
jgi:DNA-binding XRE family transcriptional regulator